MAAPRATACHRTHPYADGCGPTYADPVHSVPGELRVTGPGSTGVDVTSGHRVTRLTEGERSVVVTGEPVEPAARLAGRLLAAVESDDWWGRPEVERTVLDTLSDALGHCTVLITDRDRTMVVTDHVGTAPLFAASASPENAPTALATTSLGAARLGGRLGELDRVSAEEFVGTSRITSPFTLTDGVVRLWPGQVIRWDRSRWDASTYWELPRTVDAGQDDLPELAAAVRGALEYAAGRVATHHPRAHVLLSGGDDSRIVSAALHGAGVDLTGSLFRDVANREQLLATIAARSAKVDLRPGDRPAGHPARSHRWLVEHADPELDPSQGHSVGLLPTWDDPDEPPLFDGYYASHLKTENVATAQPSWWHLPLRPERIAVQGDRYDDVQRMWSTDDELANAIRDRFDRKLVRLDHLTLTQRHEWSTLWPTTDISSHTFASSNRLLRPTLALLAMQPVTEAAAVVPAELRANRELMRHAFTPLLGWAAFVPRSDGEVLGLPPRTDVAATVADRVVFRVADRLRGIRSGPWATDLQMTVSVDALWDAPTVSSLRELGDRVPLVRRLVEWRDHGRVGPPPTSHPSAATLRAIRVARAFTPPD